MIETAKQLIELEKQIDELEKQLKELKEQRDSVNERLADMMLDAEIQSMNVAGHTLYLNKTLQASYRKEVQDVFFERLEEHGLAAIIKPNINSNTLRATVRELIEQNGGELPDWLDGMVTVFEQTKVNIKKS